MHWLHNFTSWMWSVSSLIVKPAGCVLTARSSSPLHFLPEFHLFRHQVSCFALILLLTSSGVFFCFASPCTPRHLLYFCLRPPLRAQSHLCIHLSALADPLTSPAHSSRFLLSHPFGDTFCEGMSTTLSGLCHRNWQNLEVNIMNKCDCCV